MALLRSAATHFAQRGYAGVGVRAVLDDAGVTAPALYHHFGSKAGLYAAVVEATAAVVLETLTRAADAGDAGEDPADRVCRVIDALVALHADHPRALLLFDTVEHDVSEHAELAGLREVLERLAAFWESLGAGPGDDLAVRALVEGFVGAARHTADHTEYAAVGRRLQAIVRTGL